MLNEKASNDLLCFFSNVLYCTCSKCVFFCLCPTTTHTQPAKKFLCKRDPKRVYSTPEYTGRTDHRLLWLEVISGNCTKWKLIIYTSTEYWVLPVHLLYSFHFKRNESKIERKPWLLSKSHEIGRYFALLSQDVSRELWRMRFLSKNRGSLVWWLLAADYKNNLYYTVYSDSFLVARLNIDPNRTDCLGAPKDVLAQLGGNAMVRRRAKLYSTVLYSRVELLYCHVLSQNFLHCNSYYSVYCTGVWNEPRSQR